MIKKILYLYILVAICLDQTFDIIIRGINTLTNYGPPKYIKTYTIGIHDQILLKKIDKMDIEYFSDRTKISLYEYHENLITYYAWFIPINLFSVFLVLNIPEVNPITLFFTLFNGIILVFIISLKTNKILKFIE